MAEHDGALRQAPGPGGVHVVGPQRLEHVHPHEPDEHTADHEAERHRRQCQMAQCFPEGNEVPGEDRVERVQAGQVAGFAEGQRPATGRQPSELYGEQQLEQDPEPEDRGGVEHDSEHPAGHVEGRVPVAGGGGPDPDPDGHRHQQRRHRELQGGREPVPDRLPHRSVGGDGPPEVPMQRPADIVDVLPPQRLVEPQAAPELGDPLRRGPVPEGGGHGVPGCHPEQEEGGRQQEEQEGRGERQTGQQIAPHLSAEARRLSPASPAARSGRSGSGRGLRR